MSIKVTCPNCASRFRLPDGAAVRQSVRLRCRTCQKVFPAHGRGGESLPRILVAHPEGEVRLAVAEILAKAGYSYTASGTGRAALKILHQQDHVGLLVDCALPQMFAFELIDHIRKDDALKDLKIVLLSSVYSKTAYKRRPSSLYGADDYIEKHHLIDRLLDKFQSLLADIHEANQNVIPSRSEQDEMNERLQGAELKEVGQADEPCSEAQATRLARILVADIALYYQEKVDEGVRNGNLRMLLSDQIAEGRRLLAERVPLELLTQKDYFEQALVSMEQRRKAELSTDGADSSKGG